MEPEEGIEKVVEAIKLCKVYKDSYHSHKNNLAKYFKDKEVIEWKFESSLVFTRIDKFVQQLEAIEVGVYAFMDVEV